MPTFRARTPVRFCDLGGWTDIRIVPRGYVLNLAATLYTTVTVVTSDGGGVTLGSYDTGETVRAEAVSDLHYDGKLDLLKAAVLRSGIGGGVELRVRSDAPPASGLGSSAAVGVAVVGALAAALGRAWLPYEVAREAQALETEALGLECGVQDQFASAHGGVNAMEVRYPDANVFAVPLSPQTLLELEARLVLVYTGRSRFSSSMHERVIAAYQSGQPGAVSAFDTLAECARRGKEALLLGDLPALVAAINDNWTAQKQLHPGITTPDVDAFAARALESGALALKLNGAGGGGTATLLCDHQRVAAVGALAESAGMTVLRAGIDFTGLQVWRAD